MNLTEFGEILRSERVRHGLTVDEVASVLKINIRVVRALEAADLSTMPHAVYAKGFIRAYAAMLNLDKIVVDEACLCFDAQEAEPDNTDIQLVRRPKKMVKIGGWGWAILLLLMLGVAGWLSADTLKPYLDLSNLLGGIMDKTSQLVTTSVATPKLPAESTEASSVESNSEKPSATPASKGVESKPVSTKAVPEKVAAPMARATDSLSQAPAGNSVVPVPAPGAAGATGTAGAASLDGTSSDVVALGGVASTTRSEAAPVQPSGFALPGAPSPSNTPDTLTLQDGSASSPLPNSTASQKHQIIISALAECWVHSTADDTDTRQLSIQKGDTFALSFERKLVIRLGNAGGVRIKYDGKELPSPGKSGQVKTLTFPPVE